MDYWADSQGPARKKMRKGTKSCTECRRRKIRCTFHPDRPNTCNECRSRGIHCVDQEHTVITPPLSGSGSQHVEQPYSLRERVTQLENIVDSLTKRLDRQSTTTPPEERHEAIRPPPCLAAQPKPPVAESDELGPCSDQIQNAPVLQLFDNYLVSRREDPSNNDKFAGIKDMSLKAQAVRAELIALLPPREDIDMIINASFHWHVWQDHFPDIFRTREGKLVLSEGCCDSLVAPAEVAKALMCLCISAAHAPPDFDWQNLSAPWDPEEFHHKCIDAVDRTIVRDDEFAATLPGIETQMLLSKVYQAEGRLRKGWLVNRRAIEFAHLAGMHLSTKTKRPGDTLFERRIKIWCALAISDRTLSLILGLPYGVAESFIRPQIEQRLRSNLTAPEQYLLRIGIISGRMVDRNQDPSKMTLTKTFKLDQELQNSWDSMPDRFKAAEPFPDEKWEHYIERVPLQFLLKLLRAFLHLPLMLKSPLDPQFYPSHVIALQSAREGLVLYKVLRATNKHFMCKMLDFMAFTLCLLLIIHLEGYSDETPDYSKEQDEKDWVTVKDVLDTLRQAAKEVGGSVAAESANILGAIFDSRNCKKDWCTISACKITVPYFGTIAVGAGSKFSKGLKTREQPPNTSTTPATEAPSIGQCSGQLYTPPMSDQEVSSISNPDGTNEPSLTPTMCPEYHDESWLPRGDMLPGENAHVGQELNAFSGLFDDFGQYMWPNPDVDLGLDQGWDLNWLGGVPSSGVPPS
ncbi:unnamed protein product [Penicillium olsonii]|nr:unnamed protein product [Penicillium olsonii]CAG7933286.1 unnamed protein product [Penicillium olsonii]